MKNKVLPAFRREEDAPGGVLPAVDPLMNISVSTNNTNTHLNTTNITSLPPSLSQLQQQSQSGFSISSPSDQTANILAVGLMIVFFYVCCQRPRRPGPEHWRGAEMRRNYLEMLAQEQAKEQRETQTPEYRQRLVTHNMRTKRVISQDTHGNWTLGTVVETDSTTDAPSSEATDPPSLPLSLPSLVNDDDNEEDDVCAICLDSFQVGDVVSWARYSEECHHVFHADCILPWLHGKRQDDCPSCRHRIIIEEPRDIEEVDSGGVGQENGNSDVSHANTIPQVEEPVLDREEDSFFMIARGLISRATKQAKQSNRYSLILSQSGSKSTSSSTDEMDALMNNPLPQASPLRRVASHEPRPSPSTLIMGRRGSNLTPTLASSTDAALAFSSSPLSRLSIHNFLPSSGSSSIILGHANYPHGNSPNHYQNKILPSYICESNNGSLDVRAGTSATSNPGTTMEEYSPEDTIFRRVQSDIGSSPTSTFAKTTIATPNNNMLVVSTNGSRRYPMMRLRTRAPSVLQGGRDSFLAPSATSDSDDDDDTVVDDIFRQPQPTPTTALDMTYGDEDEDEDELQWITPGSLPASPSRDTSIEANKTRDTSDYGGTGAEQQV